MLGKKILGCLLVISLSSSVLANNSTNSTSGFGSTVLSYVPDAGSDALTTDLFVVSGLAAASALGIISGIPPIIIPAFITGAFGAQLVRHTCKHYVSEGDPSVLCGIVAGTTKYSLRSALLGSSGIPLAVNGLRGAVDIGKYEMDRASLIEAIVSGNYAKVAMMITSNEIFNAFFDVSLALYLGPQYDVSKGIVNLNTVKTAFMVPSLIIATIYTTNAYLGEPVKNMLASAMTKISDAYYGSNLDEESKKEF